MKILMTGATGLIGKEIGKRLVQEGHELTVISRCAKKARLALPFPATVIEGDLSKGPLTAPAEAEAIIHLMGESVGEKRWSTKVKADILKSRETGTKNLFLSLKRPPQVAFSASAIGFYGDRGNEVLTEDSGPGQGFLSDVCVRWESQFNESCKEAGVTRHGVIRIGVVLSPWGGALKKLIPLFKNGLGSPIGDGKQKMSWIHIEDLANLFVWGLENKAAQGAINGVSPTPTDNREFTQGLARALDVTPRPPVPKPMVQLLFGEMAAMVLGSQAVVPKKALALGFSFAHTHLSEALLGLCQDFRGGEVFYSEQYLPASLSKVFEFFSDEVNLEKLTPPSLKFTVLRKSTEKIQPGTLIDYKLKLYGVPFAWTTRIASWEPPRSFSDSQEKGPYSLWHHTHEFSPMGTGVLMTDRVRYKLPLGFLGKCVGSKFVKNDIDKIFSFRRNTILHEIFPGHV